MTVGRKPSTRTVSKAPRLSKRKLESMVEEATVDAYGESEQVGGFFTIIEEHLRIPFTTMVLGVEVIVGKIDLTEADEIIAVCRRGKETQRIPILELTLPSPPPEGSEWVAAFRYWARGRR